MSNPSFEQREFFHLNLIRQLGLRLAGRAYALKGGICLRFFHRSPRLSEDMDLDIASHVRVDTLEKAVDSILQSRSFPASLVSQGITRLEFSKPKQTQTTQRWKIALHAGPGNPLSTKLEFSRRLENIPFARGVPDGELLNHHKIAPFAAQFYDAPTMAVQKISALASPVRHAARDLFDLRHLFCQVNVKPKDIRKMVERPTLAKAVEKTRAFSVGDFKEQVLPYIPEDLMALYEDVKAFETLKKDVERALLSLSP